MGKIVRSTRNGIIAGLAAFCVLFLLFLLFEFMGFDYLLWDAPYDSQAHRGGWVNELFGTLLYVWLPIILSCVVYRLTKTAALERAKDPEPAQTDPAATASIATRMADLRGQEHLNKARNWADTLFPHWRSGVWQESGTSPSGTLEYLLRIDNGYDATGTVFSCQLHFMAREPGAAALTTDLVLRTSDHAPTQPTLSTDLCKFTADHLALVKLALEAASGEVLSD